MCKMRPGLFRPGNHLQLLRLLPFRQRRNQARAPGSGAAKLYAPHKTHTASGAAKLYAPHKTHTSSGTADL